MTALIIDIIVSVLIITAFAAGTKKGMVKTVWRAAAWLITAVLVFVLLKPTSDFLSGTEFAAHINTAISETVGEKFMSSSADEEKEIPALPGFILKDFDAESLKNSADEMIAAKAEDLSRSITLTLVKIVAFIGLFLILRVVLAILFAVLDAASKLPVINSANKLLGGLLGGINVLFVIYIICAAVSLFAANERITDIINSSYIVKYFYNNNILLQLAFRV